MSCLNEFILPIRIYYEDTDAGGIVYHANYLKFMERARTEWLRSLGMEQDALAQQGFLFVLSQLSINYRKPALFNEQIYVSSTLTECHKASMLFNQQIWRQNQADARELLADIGERRKGKLPSLDSTAAVLMVEGWLSAPSLEYKP